MTEQTAIMTQPIGHLAKLEKNKNLLLQVLMTPALMLELDIKAWNQVLFEAHRLKLRGRLAFDAKNNGLWNKIPEKVRQIMTNADVEAADRQRKIMWEVNRIRRALHGFDDKVILVKGGAYILKELKAARGRISADIDILVAKKNLDIVENHLLRAGYGSRVLNEYDQQYYREWAHELPPLVHPNRLVEVDVHHNILQVTSRLCPDIDQMIVDAVPVDGNIYVLSNVDMLLHSIVHQFVDGALKGSLRNLLEQDDLIAEFAKDPQFWPRFMARTEELALGRPVFYCLRYCQHFLNTDIPVDIMQRARKAAPNAIILKVMDDMIHRSMIPYGGKRSQILDYIATNSLYIRSHWLRMPTMMLIGHLTRKFLRNTGVKKA